MNIVSVDMQTFLRRATGGSAASGDVGFGRWSCACQDLDGVLEPLFHSRSIWSSYQNPEMDAALEAARSTLDPAERLRQYRTVHALIARDIPAVPLFQVAVIYGANARLGVAPDAQRGMFIARMCWRD